MKAEWVKISREEYHRLAEAESKRLGHKLYSSMVRIGEPPILFVWRSYDEIEKVDDLSIYDQAILRIVMEWMGPDGKTDLKGKYYRAYKNVSQLKE